MPCHDRLPDPEHAHEGLNLVSPFRERPWATSGAVTEAIQVERVHAMSAAGEQRSDVLPDEARLEKPADEDDRAAVGTPLAIRGQHTVGSHESSVPELGDRLALPVGCKVEEIRRDEQQDEGAHEQTDQADCDPDRPLHPCTLSG